MKSSREKILNSAESETEKDYSKRFKALCMLVIYTLSFLPFVFADDDNVIRIDNQLTPFVSFTDIDKKNQNMIQESVKEEINLNTPETPENKPEEKSIVNVNKPDIVALNSSKGNVLPEAELPLEAKAIITKKEGGVITLGKTKIEIPAGAVKKDTEITIERLENVKETGESIANVTEFSGGYRFLPAGTKFKKDVIVSIPYEKELNAKKESLEETYTYFFDVKKETWIALERIEIDRENCLIKSKTNHFTDMINATLTMPETASPSEVNLNRIKNLEAAKPDGHLVKFNAPQSSNTGDAAFSFELDVAPGRRGLSPQLAVSYSSANGNGLMGKGFDLICNDSIVTDTRMGLPKYDGRDTYLKDGIILECTDNKQHSYVPKREASYSKIERFNAGSEDDYWKVTEKNGLVKVYGKYIQYNIIENNSVVKGLDCNKNEKAYIWNLTEVIDTYGNSILYKYRKDKNSVYLDEILYTGKDGKEGKYFVSFEYFDGIDGRNLRKDGRIDARSGNIIESNYLLKSIKTGYDKEAVRTYEFIYGERIVASEKYLKEFKVWNKGNKESYSYFFDYNELDLNNIFASPEEYSFNEPIQAGVSKSTSSNVSVSAGVGVGNLSGTWDLRGTGGYQGASSKSTSYSDDMTADMDGDGKPDSIMYAEGSTRVLKIILQSGKEWTVDCSDFESDVGLNYETGDTDSNGYTVYGGAGIKSSITLGSGSVGVNYSNVKQTGTSSLQQTLADMDGDGRPDIIHSNKSFYLHNNGDGTFSKKSIYATTDKPLDSYRRKLEEKEVEEYKDTYRQQLPFRVWKAPYNGRIKISHKGQFADGCDRNKPVFLNTYIGEKSDIENSLQLKINSDELKTAEDENARKIEQGRNIYFAPDTGADPENSDITWNTKISYESIQVFNNENKSPVFLPDMEISFEYNPSLTGHSTLSKEDMFSAKTKCPSEFYDINSENINKNQNTTVEVYKITGTLKSDWNKVDAGEDKCINFAAKLIDEKKVIPRYYSPDEFEAICEKVYERAEKISKDSVNGYFYLSDREKKLLKAEYKVNYLNEFSYHFRYDKIKNTYEYISQGYSADKGFLAKFLDGMKLREIVYAHYRRNDVDAFMAVNAPLYKKEKIIDNSEKERGSGIIGSFRDTRYLYLGKLDGKVLELDIVDKTVLCDKNIIAESDFDIKDNNLISFIYENKNRVNYKFEDREKTASFITSSEIQSILEHYKAISRGNVDTDEEGNIIEKTEEEIESEASSIMKDDFKEFYTVESETWNLIDYWKTEKTQSDFTVTDENGKEVEDKAAYKQYSDKLKKLKNLTLMFALVKFNKYTVSITYLNDAEYTLSKNGKYSVLKLNEEGTEFYYEDFYDLTKITWDSEEDFNTVNISESKRIFENFKYYSLIKKDGKDYKEIISETEFSDSEQEAEVRIIEVLSKESFYGGEKQWYYGVWNGKVAFNPLYLYRSEKNEQECQETKKKAEKNSQVSEDDSDVSKRDYDSDSVYYNVQKNVDEQGDSRISKSEYKKQFSSLGNTEIKNVLIGNVSVVSRINGNELENRFYAPFIYKNFMHCDRFGGTTFYDIDGMSDYLSKENGSNGTATPFINEKEKECELELQEIQKSKTSGTDKTIGPDFSVSFAKDLPEEIFKQESSEIKVNFQDISIGSTHGSNSSESQTVMSMQDINGDLVPDILFADKNNIRVRPSVKVKADNGYKVVYDKEILYSNTGYISENTSSMSTDGASFSSQGSVKHIFTANGKIKITTPNPSSSGGGGASVTTGRSYQKKGLLDFNGDGLPDYFSEGNIQLNKGNEFESYNYSGIESYKNLNSSKTECNGYNFTLGISKTMSESLSTSLSAGGSVNLSFSGMRTDSMVMDLNGDGLADYVFKENGKWKVSFNNGKGFDDSIEFNMPGWDSDSTLNADDKRQLFFNADNAFNVGILSNIPYTGNIAGEIIKGGVMRNKYAIDPDFYESLDLSTSATIGISGSFTESFTASFRAWFFAINVTATGSGGVSASSSINGVTVRMLDIDGDGLADQVMRIPGTVTVGDVSLKTGKIYYKKNLSGKAGLLKTITTPQGGTVDIDYEGIYGTKDMPYHKYVMKSVTVDDGTGKILPEVVVKENGTEAKNTHSIKTEYKYENARYNRIEKEFYGFEKVTAENPDG
uniref:toxin TcdB middle/N-terminal domain-containing protein n=1 Tax=Treponema sp. TaxID=166 RepID=UPI00298E9DEE